MRNVESAVRQRLLELKEDKYRAFQCALMPGVDAQRVLGVRTPLLRKIVREMVRNGEAEAFLSALPHAFYEENNLHALLVMEIKDEERLFEELNRFLPFVDNWATCDMLRPPLLKKIPERTRQEIRKWMRSGEPYAVRFGLEMLMMHFLKEHFDESVLQEAAAIASEEYYVKMMQAWFFATALAERYDEALPFLQKGILEEWVRRKALQKARESLRMSEKQKEKLKSLR